MAATGYFERPRMSAFFIEGLDIHKDVIMTDITQYVGEVANLESGGYWDSKLGRQLYGYHITAYRRPTWGHLQQLRRDSTAWGLELERRTHGQEKLPVQAPYPGTLWMNSVLLENSPPVTDPHRDGSLRQAWNMDIPSPISYSQPPSLMQSQSSAAQSAGENVKDIILMYPQSGSSCTATALLDTDYATGNWISGRMIRKLGTERFVGYGPSVTLQGPNGGVVQSKGDIQLAWRWVSNGTNFNTLTFHVADVENFDVIIVDEYAEQKRLQSWHPESPNPLTRYNPVIPPYGQPTPLENFNPQRAIRPTNEPEEVRQVLLAPEPEKVRMKFEKENMDLREPGRDSHFGAYSQCF